MKRINEGHFKHTKTGQNYFTENAYRNLYGMPNKTDVNQIKVRFKSTQKVKVDLTLNESFFSEDFLNEKFNNTSQLTRQKIHEYREEKVKEYLNTVAIDPFEEVEW